MRHIPRAEVGLDDAPHGGNGFTGDLHPVGSHIGDQPDGFAADVDAFVEPLRDAHSMGRRKAELAARFLLQGRGGKRRLRIPPHRLCFHRIDRKRRTIERLLESFGLRAGADVEALKFFAVGAHEPRFKSFLARGRQRRDQRPIFAADEFFYFKLAVANQTQRDGLNPSRRTRARKFSPQHRRERKSDEVIERAAREIGIDQRLVDAPRVRHRFVHRLLGDGVEDHAVDRLAV